MRILTWDLAVTKQCDKCPWRVDTNPNTIPWGYSREKHKALIDTIAKPRASDFNSDKVSMMACHESTNDNEYVCIGWLHNQMNQGNNIPLRIHMKTCTNVDDITLQGEQHCSFKDTIAET